MTYCTDLDLLHDEPNLFRDASAAAQLLMSGTGTLAGSSLTIAAGSFIAEHVAVGGVVVLEAAPLGSYGIIAVNSATQLTISALYEGLFPTDGSAAVPTPVGSGSNIPFSIRTFWPQRQVIGALLTRAAGIGKEINDATSAIINTEALRRPCALGTIHLVYRALAAVAADPAINLTRADLYERLFRRSLSRTRVEIDANGDGVGDLVRHLGVVDMQRV